ncbi:NYN domain-containing protein [Vicingaceae bacterium]|nr:NYN domain-containing protein [Vicingaceae bacterium]
MIDGYNLLLQTSLVPRTIGPGTLTRARRALVNLLSDRLDEEERSHTTIVFDAKRLPRGEKVDSRLKGLRVLYAVDHPEADDLIEELIRSNSVPKSLVVVSSDHRLQTAAARRKATPIDSDVWFDQLLERVTTTIENENTRDSVRSRPLSPEELSNWLNEFSDLEIDSIIAEVAAEDGEKIAEQEPVNPDETEEEDSKIDLLDEYNPFPPGYGSDLFEDD